MTLLTPPVELDSPGGPRLSVVLAVASGLLLLLAVAAIGIIGVVAAQPGDAFAGDPKAVESIVLSSAFNESDTFECSSGEGSRCYLTSLGVKATLVEVTQALGASTYSTVESRYGTAYTVCAHVEGTPTVGIVRPHVDNAISIGSGRWKLPKKPTFDGRLSVAFIALTKSPVCI